MIFIFLVNIRGVPKKRAFSLCRFPHSWERFQLNFEKVKKRKSTYIFFLHLFCKKVEKRLNYGENTYFWWLVKNRHLNLMFFSKNLLPFFKEYSNFSKTYPPQKNLSISHNNINRLCNNRKPASPLTLQACAFVASFQKQCCDQTQVCHDHATTSASISSSLNWCRIFYTESSHLNLRSFESKSPCWRLFS